MGEEIKVIVVGAAGRMGGRLIHIIQETPSMKLLGPLIGRIIPSWEGHRGGCWPWKAGIPLEGELKGGEMWSSISAVHRPP